MNAIQFDVKDKSAEISVDDLVKTMKLGDSMGNMPKQIPMQPGELLDYVSNEIHRVTGYRPISKPIVIREPYCQTNLNKLKSGSPLELEDYIIKRFVTKLELPLPMFQGDDLMRPSFALTYAYTDSIKGMQLAFGQNVSICENLTAFGQYHFSTYGNSRVSFEDGMQLFKFWIQNFETINTKHEQVIQYLMDTPVNRNEFQRLVGSLFEKAVRANNGEPNMNAPLNQSQVAGMVQKGLTILREDQPMSAWDVMNWGTYTLKPHNSDMTDLLKDTAAFNDFILQEVNCPINIAV